MKKIQKEKIGAVLSIFLAAAAAFVFAGKVAGSQVYPLTPPVTPTETPVPTETPTPTDTPEPTPTPTLTLTPTPAVTPPAETYWSTFGPKGTPDASWDTAAELLELLDNKGYQVLDIARWKGRWDGHVRSLPLLNNFAIQEGEGYFIHFAQDPGSSWQNEVKPYTALSSLTISIYISWNFISIPEGLTANASSVEELCQDIADQGGDLAEVLKIPTYASSTKQSTWITHVCGSNENNFEIEPGKGYFVKSSVRSEWVLNEPVPTAAPTPTPTPVNQAPVVYPENDNLRSAKEGRPFWQMIRASDPDGDRVDLRMENLPEGLNSYCLSRDSRAYCLIYGRPKTAGVFNVQAIAADSQGSVTNKTYTLTVDPVKRGYQLKGKIQLQGRSNHETDLRVEMVKKDNNSKIRLENVRTNTEGIFTINNVEPAVYLIKIKSPQTLAKKAEAAVDRNAVEIDFGTLLTGDANNDNRVDAGDLAILLKSFGKKAGQTGFDARADFNADGAVNILDFSLLASNYRKVGE